MQLIGKKIIISMDTEQPVNISVLNASQFLDNTFRNVKSAAILKCFHKSKLRNNLSAPDKDGEFDLLLSEWIKKFKIGQNDLTKILAHMYQCMIS